MNTAAPDRLVRQPDLPRTGYPLSAQIEDLARDLLDMSRWLTPMAVDYIFYHHFLDPRLQRGLRRLRRGLLGPDEPVPHLSLMESAALLQLAREELEDGDRKIAQRAKKTAEESTRRLNGALREARRQGTSQAFERAAQPFRRPPKPRPTRQEKRLDELARWVPADRLSLTFALLCGTPVLPPGLVPWGVDDDAPPFVLVRPPSMPAGVAWELTDDAGLVFTIYSAKIRQLNAAYRDVVEHHQRVVSLAADPPAYSSGGSVSATYGAGPGLPRITIDARRAADFSWPLPDLVDGVFRAARRAYGKLLYDGGRKGRDARFAVRAWTVALLSDQAKISRREAISSWNRLAPGDLSYRHTPRGVTSSGEIQFQQDYRRLRDRIERFASEAPKPPQRRRLISS